MTMTTESPPKSSGYLEVENGKKSYSGNSYLLGLTLVVGLGGMLFGYDTGTI